MNKRDTREILDWMREHAWQDINLNELTCDILLQRQTSASRMLRRINTLKDGLDEGPISIGILHSGRAAAFVGVSVLIADLLATGGALTILTKLAIISTTVGGGSETLNIINGKIRKDKKSFLNERLSDINNYTAAVGDARLQNNCPP